MLKKVVALLFSITLFSCSPKKEPADLVLHNAVIYSVDSAFTVYEAVAIKGGKIIALGRDADILAIYNPHEKIDAQKKSVFPGFIDAHCHFLSYGLGITRVDLVGTKSFGDVIQKVVAFSVKSDEGEKPSLNKEQDWIMGRGWDQNDWEKKEYPTKKMLDSLFPNTPVILTRVDGHAALVNQKALDVTGISTITKIDGGEIEIKNKQLTGILIDNAVDLVTSKIPPPSIDKIARALQMADLNCIRFGLTTVDDAGLMQNEINIIDSLQKLDQIHIRLYAILSDSAPNYKMYLNKGPYKTDRLNVRSFKYYADGALGSRGACLLKSYSDKKNWNGFLLNTKEHFEKYAKLMIEKGFQMNTHCIGDSAYRLILSVYKGAGATKEKRWRIEHAQVVDPEDLKRSDFIIPSVQPTHATSDMYWAKDRLGDERVKNAYACKDLLKASGILALGTDFPVEDISPFKTFYAAVARKDSKGFPENGFQMENALIREEALKGMTIWAAYSNFEENEKGSLEKGKFADLVILDNDLMKCNIHEVLKTKVIATYINGEKVFPKN